MLAGRYPARHASWPCGPSPGCSPGPPCLRTRPGCVRRWRRRRARPGQAAGDDHRAEHHHDDRRRRPRRRVPDYIIVHRHGEAHGDEHRRVHVARRSAAEPDVPEPLALRTGQPRDRRAADVPGEVAAARRLGRGAAPGAPERQHRMGPRQRGDARAEPLPHRGVARRPHHHRHQRERGDLQRRGRGRRARHPDAHGHLLPLRAAPGPRPERARTVRSPTGCRVTPTRSRPSPAATPRSASTATTTRRRSGRACRTAASAWTTPPSATSPASSRSARRSTSPPEATCPRNVVRGSVPTWRWRSSTSSTARR